MVLFIVVIACSIWVFFDARSIGIHKTSDKTQTGKVDTNMGPFGWALCTLLLWIVAFPLYLFKRPGYKRRFQAASESNPVAIPAQQGSVPASNLDQQLRNLAKLREDNVITPDEFEQKKKQLLGI